MAITVNNSSRGTRFRVGLLIDSFIQDRWVHKIIQDIQSSPIAEISLVIKNASRPSNEVRLKSYWKNRNYLLYALYSRLDNYKLRTSPDAFQGIDIQGSISNCPLVSVQPINKRYSDWFPDEIVTEIQGYELDVALAFGFRILRGNALKIARHGVWSYHHGDNLVNRGGPAGFWEVFDGVSVTGSILQILTEQLDNGIVIYRSWSSTSDRFSVQANKNNLYWKSSSFVMRKLRDLAADNSVCLPENRLYRPYSHRLYKTPTNSEMMSRLTRLGTKYAGSKIQNALCFNQWSLAYRFRNGPSDPNNAFYKFKYMIPPKDRFWADPFAEKNGSSYYIFVEEYIYQEKKGHVSVFEVDRNGISTGPIRVLERNYHLSYPSIFRWNGNYYMVPETAANKTIELYRSPSFPFIWEFETVLLSGVSAKDATLIEVDGRWWMFVSLAENFIPDELYLYFADNPRGPWKAHKRNPVKSDVRGSRPAGRLFYWNGDLYRPAQDSSQMYGYAISLNKVLRLDPDEFLEKEVSKILPNWDKKVLATHTLNTCDDLTVIDCLIRRWR